MKFELLQLEEDRIRYLLSGVTAAFSNGIRRACMSEVPVLAIDEIGLYDNTSVLFDEQIGLRLGEVPLRARDLDIFCRWVGAAARVIVNNYERNRVFNDCASEDFPRM